MMRGTFTIEYSVDRESSVVGGTAEQEQGWLSAGRSPAVEPETADHGVGDGDRETDRAPSVASSDLDVDHDANLPVMVRRLSDIVSELEEREPQLHVLSSEEPASLIEAQADMSWRASMKEEMDAIEDNQTWTLCDLPQGC
jgi:hypothetical protein